VPQENFIITHWDQQLAVFKTNLEIIKQKPVEAAVHDLRVAVKKLRSYLRLAGEIRPFRWKTLFSSTQQIFKAAGRVRDMDICLSLLSSLQQTHGLVLPVLSGIFDRQKDQAEERLIRQAGLLDMKELEQTGVLLKNTLGNMNPDELENKTRKILRKKIKKLQQLVRDLSRNLHRFRILLKDVYYWIKLHPDTEKDTGLNIKEVEHLLDELGSWHDHYIFLQETGPGKKQVNLLAEEEVAFKKIQKVIRANKHALFKKVSSKKTPKRIFSS